jgi:hypothetical protein
MNTTSNGVAYMVFFNEETKVKSYKPMFNGSGTYQYGYFISENEIAKDVVGTITYNEASTDDVLMLNHTFKKNEGLVIKTTLGTNIELKVCMSVLGNDVQNVGIAQLRDNGSIGNIFDSLLPAGVFEIYGFMELASKSYTEQKINELKDIISIKKVVECSETIPGYMKTNGTIDTSITTGGEIGIYYIEDDVNKIELNFESNLSVGKGWATLWLLDDNDNVLYYEEPETEPQTYMNHIVNVVSGATKLYLQFNGIVKMYSPSAIKDIAKSVNHWNDKKWYAYGTSITSTSQGKYANYLAQLSGLNLVNKGIAGGGITNLGGYSNGEVKEAIMNITDGKLEADLITFEVGANEGGTLGTKYDTDDSTFCGCLNQCIRYLQANTNAQIVVMYSVSTTTEPSEITDYYEREEKVREVCNINNVYYLGANSGLGYARISNNGTYTLDTIHQTNVGGYNLAQFIWSKLKNIPLWYSELPQ